MWNSSGSEFELEAEAATPRPRRRSPPPAPPAVEVDDAFGSELEEHSESLDDTDDFCTDSNEEEESSAEEEEYTWAKPKAWPAEVWKNPWLEKFAAAVWTSPAARGSVPSVRCGPDQACRFNVEPSGDRPYSNLFLSALPVKMFWTDVWAVETKRYHKVVTEMGQAPTPTVRPWTDDNVTPANALRMVAAVVTLTIP